MEGKKTVIWGVLFSRDSTFGPGEVPQGGMVVAAAQKSSWCPSETQAPNAQATEPHPRHHHSSAEVRIQTAGCLGKRNKIATVE